MGGADWRRGTPSKYTMCNPPQCCARKYTTVVYVWCMCSALQVNTLLRNTVYLRGHPTIYCCASKYTTAKYGLFKGTHFLYTMRTTMQWNVLHYNLYYQSSLQYRVLTSLYHNALLCNVADKILCQQQLQCNWYLVQCKNLVPASSYTLLVNEMRHNVAGNNLVKLH